MSDEGLKPDAPQQTDITPAPPAEPAKPAEAAKPVEPAKPVDRRTAIAQAMDKAEAKKAGSPSPEPARAEGDRQRNEKGQFVAAQGTPAAAARKAMPKAWKQDYQPKWEALDSDTANFLAEIEEKREKDFLAGIDKYKQEAAAAAQLRGLFQPYEAPFKAQYGSIERGVETLLKISDYANRDPNGFIRWFAQNRGIQLAGPQGNGGEQPAGPQDELNRSLQSALQPWIERTARLEQQLQSFTSNAEQSALDGSIRTINGFLEMKDDKGGLKHPLAEEHTDAFTGHIQAIRARQPDWDDQRVLDQAYENLTWSVPELRAKRLEAEAQAKREEEARQAALRKQAAVQVKGAPAQSAPQTVNPKDRRAVIERALDGLQR